MISLFQNTQFNNHFMLLLALVGWGIIVLVDLTLTFLVDLIIPAFVGEAIQSFECLRSLTAPFASFLPSFWSTIGPFSCPFFTKVCLSFNLSCCPFFTKVCLSFNLSYCPFFTTVGLSYCPFFTKVSLSSNPFALFLLSSFSSPVQGLGYMLDEK